MSLQIKREKQRAVSAKISIASHNIRPFSGSQRVSVNYDSIQNVYSKGKPSVRHRIQSGNNKGRYLVISQTQKINRLQSAKNRQKQEMTEEILSLKLTIKGLNEQLFHQKMKVEELRKKARQSGKALELQFERQGQWGLQEASARLVTGIKAMYNQLKEKYQNKCKELEQISKLTTTSNMLEQQILRQTILEEMKNLQHQNSKLMQLKHSIGIFSQTNQQATELTIQELNKEKQIYLQRCSVLQKKVDKQIREKQDLHKKINILEKRIIDKDNLIHTGERKIKSIQRQTNQLKKQLKQVHVEKDEVLLGVASKEEMHRKNIEIIQQNYKIQIKNIKEENNKAIIQLQKDIDVQKELNKDLKQTNNQLRKMICEYKEQMAKQKKQFSLKKQQSNAFKDIIQNTPILLAEQNNSNQIIQHGQRVARRADKKHCKEALKKRTVKIHQINDCAEYIKLKLMVLKINSDKLKEYFSFNQEEEIEKDQAWAQEYITMKQVKNILSNYPFNLEEEQAELFSRYLIEDTNEDYVYRDELNENTREVVKAIIKNLIQDYPVLSENSSIEKECSSMINKYGQNLKAALIQIAPSGFISKQKLLETMIGIGIDVSSQVLQFFVGKIALTSKSLRNLQYTLIFE